MVLLLACGGRGSEAAPAAPAAIVVIVIDALRADHFPCYGYARDTAPFLARLAAEGVVFERAYSTATWTAPAMASLFTSVYPLQHSVLAGLNVGETLGFVPGFDELVSFRWSCTAAGVNAQLAEWEPWLAVGGRYFLFVHYLDPHFPFRTPEPAFRATGNNDLAHQVANYDSEIRHVDGRVEKTFRRFA